MSNLTLSLSLPDEQATIDLARRIAPLLEVGDCFLLEGAIGAGKTAFCRALIRARLGRMEDVPSPTFTLVQTYEDDAGDLWHFDLYRLTHPDEVFELGLDDALTSAICLIEWPDRMGDQIPENAAVFSLESGPTAHHLSVSIPEKMQPRLAAVFANA